MSGWKVLVLGEECPRHRRIDVTIWRKPSDPSSIFLAHPECSRSSMVSSPAIAKSLRSVRAKYELWLIKHFQNRGTTAGFCLRLNTIKPPLTLSQPIGQLPWASKCLNYACRRPLSYQQAKDGHSTFDSFETSCGRRHLFLAF